MTNNTLEWMTIISAKSSVFSDLIDSYGSAICVKEAMDLVVMDCYFIKCTATSTTVIGYRDCSGGAILAVASMCLVERSVFRECSGKEMGSTLFVSSAKRGPGLILRQTSSEIEDGDFGIFTDYISPYISELNCSFLGPHKAGFAVAIGEQPNELSVRFLVGISTLKNVSLLSISSPSSWIVDSLVAIGFRETPGLFLTLWGQVRFRNVNVINCSGTIHMIENRGSILFEDSMLGSEMELSEGVVRGSNVTMKDGINIINNEKFIHPYITKCKKMNAFSEGVRVKGIWIICSIIYVAKTLF